LVAGILTNLSDGMAGAEAWPGCFGAFDSVFYPAPRAPADSYRALDLFQVVHSQQSPDSISGNFVSY
jgi:hypothetical protein